MLEIEGWKQAARRWSAPHQVCIEAIDAHTAGEPLRIFIDGFPTPDGSTILQRRQDALERLEFYRTGTMLEPRGHADMYGCLIVPPERTDSDFGVLFMHNQGYSSMCGHGIIAIAKVAVQLGWIQANANPIRINIDAPAGLITANVHLDAAQAIDRISFTNVPSFVVATGQQIEIPELGLVNYDLAYGGAFYAYVDVDPLGIELTPNNVPLLIKHGRAVKQAASDHPNIKHPRQTDLSFLYGTIFTSKAHHAGNHSRHVCVFADGEVDRSPTGTGVSGRAAILAFRNQLDVGEAITIESVLGSTFAVEIESVQGDAPASAVIPKVTGNAYITGRHQFFFDPDDDLRRGFMLR